jgi:hypothetical protein
LTLFYYIGYVVLMLPLAFVPLGYNLFGELLDQVEPIVGNVLISANELSPVDVFLVLNYSDSLNFTFLFVAGSSYKYTG